MLILTRKPGESLYIGHVKVTIVEIKGHQIRIGIDAPKEIRIYREEIYLQILEENKKAAAAAPSESTTDLEGLTAAWENRPAEGAPPAASGSDDESKKRKLGGLSSLTTSVGGSAPPGKAPSGNGGADPQVVVRRKRGKKPDE